jgi:hypothetical protein
MIDSFQKTKQALHISAPFIKHVICVSRLGEADDSGRSVDLGVHCLGCNQLTDILLCLILGQVEKLGQAWHLDSGVIFGNDTDVVFNDTLVKIFPSLMCLLVCRLTLRGIENICAAEMRTEQLSDFWPSHEFMNGEELEELSVEGNLRDSGIFLNAMEEV